MRSSDCSNLEIQWRSSGVTPDPESFSGHDRARRWFAKQEEVFEAVRFVPQEIVAHDDRVSAALHISARGRGSGAKVEMTMFQRLDARGPVGR